MSDGGNEDGVGELLLEAARLQCEARGRGSEEAEIITDVVRAKLPDARVAAGNELAQPGKGGTFLLKTLDHPDSLAAEASDRRLQLASNAGALTLAIDTADTIGAENSAEQMLAHQMAGAHRGSMKLLEQMNALLRENLAANCDSANVRATRLAGAAARLMGVYQGGLLTLQRLRSGGTQKILVQHVTVEGGGQAVVTGEVSGGGPAVSTAAGEK
jgi:hypothetical protein